MWRQARLTTRFSYHRTLQIIYILMQLFGYKNDSWEIERCDQPIESFEKRHYIADHHSYGIFLSDSFSA